MFSLEVKYNKQNKATSDIYNDRIFSIIQYNIVISILKKYVMVSLG